AVDRIQAELEDQSGAILAQLHPLLVYAIDPGERLVAAGRRECPRFSDFEAVTPKARHGRVDLVFPVPTVSCQRIQQGAIPTAVGKGAERYAGPTHVPADAQHGARRKVGDLVVID